MNKIFFSLIERIILKISSSLMDIASIALIIWPFIVTVYVILRYFDIAWLFVEEVTEYMLVAFTYLTLGYTLREGGHIIIDSLVMYAPANIRKILEIFANILSLYVAMYLLNKSIVWLKDGYLLGLKSHYPSATILWPIFALIPIGLFVFTLEHVVLIFKKIKEKFI